ncbi:MAG: hypothetical protein WAM58_15715, partial [Candidatus Acidiferrum sp.]
MATPPKTLKPDLSSLRISDTKRTNPRRSRRWIWIALAVIFVGLVGGAAFAYRNRKAEVEVAAATKPATGPAGVLNASGYVTP